MIKRLLYIFIPVLAVFLMSHNASAIDLSIDLDNYSLRQSFNRPNLIMDYNNDTTTCQNIPSCTPTGTTWVEVKSMYSSQSHTYKKGDIVEFTVFVGTQSQNEYFYKNHTYLQINFNEQNSNISYIGENIEDEIDFSYIFSDIGLTPIEGEQYTDVSSKFNNLKLHKYYFRVINDFDGYIGFKSSNYSSKSYSLWNYYVDNANGNLTGGVYFRGVSLKIYEFLGSQINREVENKTQDAADNSSAAGSSSSSDATSATSSLLSVIGSGIGAITTATPSNCKINGNMGNLDIGEIDLCANPVPVYMATIGSFIAVMLILPLVIILFNRFISIIRSFQG